MSPYVQMASPVPNVLQTVPATIPPQVQWIGVEPLAKPTAEIAEQQMEQLRANRRERDRDLRKKMREEDPAAHMDRLAARRQKEREMRRQEREIGAAARENRLERRRIREKEQRLKETPEERAQRLIKRKNSEWQRFMNKISSMPEDEKAKALAILKVGQTGNKKAGLNEEKKKTAKDTGISVSLNAKDIMGGDDEALVGHMAPADSTDNPTAPTSLQALVNAATACC
jgi:hypothetical protein